jgi:hypothetical protein
MRKPAAAAVCGALLLVFSCGVSSCGMEDYLYLNPVGEGNITNIGVAAATIRLPNFSTTEYYYFTHFSLFYRIYISDRDIITTYPYHSSDLSVINSALASDFSALSYYTSSTTTVTTNLGPSF